MSNRGQVTELIKDENTYSRIFHMKIEGANNFIGKFIGETLKKQYNFNPPPVDDIFIYKTQLNLNYMTENYSAFNERIEDFSSVFNSDQQNPEFNCSYFGSALGESLCSAVYFLLKALQKRKEYSAGILILQQTIQMKMRLSNEFIYKNFTRKIVMPQFQ